MKRITKIIYFSLLFIIALIQLILGNTLLSICLFGLLAVAIQWFEKREARRQFYRALRKLYVCVDMRAYETEIEKLKKNRLIKRYSEANLLLLEAIALYYNGKRSEAKKILTSLDLKKDMSFWKYCYLLLIQLNYNSVDVSQMDTDKIEKSMSFYNLALNDVKRVPLFFKEIAIQRIMVFDLMIKSNLELDEIEQLRDLVKYNLFIAELTNLMALYSKEERLKVYYEKGVINLSKGLTI